MPIQHKLNLNPLQAATARDVFVRMGTNESLEAIAEELARSGVEVAPIQVPELIAAVLHQDPDVAGRHRRAGKGIQDWN